MEIRHHAYLYAILCKTILEEAGEEEGEKLIHIFTQNYGIARGRRMKEHSPDGGMNDFFIAGEWKGKEGENLSSLSYEKDAYSPGMHPPIKRKSKRQGGITSCPSIFIAGSF